MKTNWHKTENFSLGIVFFSSFWTHAKELEVSLGYRTFTLRWGK
jgi:hypothetical protein